MPSLAFSNQKGGVGKSTLTILFAHWLAEKKGSSVCVVDLDSQSNTSKALAQFDVGVGAAALFTAEAIQMPGAAPSSIGVLSGSKQLANVELARPEAVLPVFREQIRALSSVWDWVLVDTPPALGLRMSGALISVDTVICPIELEEFSIDGVTDMLKTVFGIQQRHNPRLQLAGIVANRFNPHSVRQKAALHHLLSAYGNYVIPARISTRSAIPEALAAGIPVWRLGKTSAWDASKEVFEMFELLWQRIEGQRFERRACDESSI